jgi:hypothetical protein
VRDNKNGPPICIGGPFTQSNQPQPRDNKSQFFNSATADYGTTPH